MQLDIEALLKVLIPAIIAVCTGLFAWLGGRRKAKAEAEVTIAGGFQILVNKLQEERQELMKVVDEQSTELVALRSEVRNLSRQVALLERQLARHGIDLPSVPNAPSTAG